MAIQRVRCESGGIGRRARFRILSGQPGGGSSPPFRTNYSATYAGASGAVSLWGFASSPTHPTYDATSRRLRVAVRQPPPSPARLPPGLRPPWLRPHSAVVGKFESPLWVISRPLHAARTTPSATSAYRCCRCDRVPPFAPTIQQHTPEVPTYPARLIAGSAFPEGSPSDRSWFT